MGRPVHEALADVDQRLVAVEQARLDGTERLEHENNHLATLLCARDLEIDKLRATVDQLKADLKALHTYCDDLEKSIREDREDEDQD